MVVSLLPDNTNNEMQNILSPIKHGKQENDVHHNPRMSDEKERDESTNGREDEESVIEHDISDWLNIRRGPG